MVPALVRRYVEAVEGGLPEVSIWGDGSARRDFLFIADCIDAMVRLLEGRFSGPVNVATGEQTTIRELAAAVSEVSGFEGRTVFDTSMPAGQHERRFDLSRIRATGWTPAHTLREGLNETVAWFRAHRSEIRER